MGKYILTGLVILMIFTSCEEVIDIDLNSSDPEFVVEAVISKDSVCVVQLTRTSAYFTPGEPEYIEDAEIIINDGTLSEDLAYVGEGIYRGNTIVGKEERAYEIEIKYNGISYEAVSYMPTGPVINSIRYYKSDRQSTLNPLGKTVIDVHCEFTDDILSENFYLIRFSDENGKLIERYYLLTENESNSGSINCNNGNISFSESIFYEGNFIEIKIFSVDKAVYDYFLQLTDILFWKRRIMPPTPYNPDSNISNGALGYFAAWSYNLETINLE